jgi:hypothetical protein
MSPAITWMVQTAGGIPGNRAVNVVVPSAFGIRVPVLRSNVAIVVSPNSQATRASGIGVESAASARAVKRRVERRGSWTGPTLWSGEATSACGSW